MDLSSGGVPETAISNLSAIKLTCATDIQMKDGLITVYCAEDRTISFLLNSGDKNLQLITQQQVFDEEYEIGDVMLVHHAANAYQIFVQGRPTTGDDIKTTVIHYEVLVESDKVVFYQSKFNPNDLVLDDTDENKKFTLQTVSKDQYLMIRNEGETDAKALRLCNLNEEFNASYNACRACPLDKFPK